MPRVLTRATQEMCLQVLAQHREQQLARLEKYDRWIAATTSEKLLAVLQNRREQITWKLRQLENLTAAAHRRPDGVPLPGLVVLPDEEEAEA
jgi:hypothetical protein